MVEPDSNLRKRIGKDKSKSPEKKSTPKKKKQSKFYKWLWKYFIYGFVAFPAFITVVIIALPSPIEPINSKLPDPPEWTGPLSVNSRLSNAQLLFENEIIGPESLLVDKDAIVTGTYDGKIIQIRNGKITREIRLRHGPCGTYDTEPTCGRPLGMRWSSKDTIIVADAYLGLYTVNIATGKFQQLVKGGAIVDGRPLTFLNDVDVVANGTIFFTDSSSKWERRNFIYSLLEGSGDGRLLSYCPETKKVRVLLDNLHFPNGVQLDKNENYVLINELAKARIIKYHLKGSRAGSFDYFVENLPGFPDNIRMSKNGSYWIGVSTIRRKGTFSLLDSLGPHPYVRGLLSKIIPAKYVVQLMHRFLPTYGLVLLIDPNGKYVSSLHDPTGKVVPSVSEVEDDGTALYLGSYHSKFIVKVNL